MRARSSRNNTTGLENDDDSVVKSEVIYSSDGGPLTSNNSVPAKYILFFVDSTSL